MSVKSNGQGTIFFNKQRKNWSAQYLEFDTKKGKMIKKTKSFITKKGAEKFLSTKMYQKDNSLYIINNGIPLCEFMKANLKRKLDTNQISSTQYSRVLQTIFQIEKLPLGMKKIDEITSEELQEYMNSFIHLSNSSITKIYQQLNQTFKIAINKGYLFRNPMVDVIKPKSIKEDKEVRALTVDEQQRFTAYLLNKDVSECKYKNEYLLQMYMGLRAGEALALTINDIDLKDRKIYIHRTLSTDEKGNIIMGNKTKTYAGKRILPIPKHIYPNIIEQMKIAKNQFNNPEKLLFKPDDKQYTRRTNVNTQLKRILKSHFGINDITTHSLRHTFATRCSEAGMALVVVKKLMGHKDIQVTLNRYTDVQEGFKIKELEKINEYYISSEILSELNVQKEQDIYIR